MFEELLTFLSCWDKGFALVASRGHRCSLQTVLRAVRRNKLHALRTRKSFIYTTTTVTKCMYTHDTSCFARIGLRTLIFGYNF